MKRSLGAALAVTLFAVAGPVMASARDNGLCAQTSKAAKQACRNEVLDDYWIAVGKCKNLSSDAARKQCEAEAKAERTEAHAECDEQFEARQDLCRELGRGPYDPVVDPDDFLSPEETAAHPNPFFPLVPGLRWVYEAEDETVTVTVTDRTREIQGVECIVVRDVVDEEGEVVEDTDDYFAQDRFGNVWYFGEISLNFEDGRIEDVEGSWRAGVDGAKAGIVMKANPMVGDVYRQEFALGDAEDAGKVLSITGSESVPAASCNGTCVVTADFSPLEPGALEHKYYAPWIGLILEVDPETGERLELVEVEIEH
jgi:hypothetical protein